jgi:hypothetical protein
MTMIRRATGKIESYTKKSGEVVENIRYAEGEDNIITADLEEEILDEVAAKQVAKNEEKQ